VVYDRDRQRAHHLNETATAVWQRLDGQTSTEEIATDLRCDSNVVIMAIDHLQSAHLLESNDPSLVSRRSAVRKVARLAAAGVVLPVVSSIAAPTPTMVQSGGGAVECADQAFGVLPRAHAWIKRRRRSFSSAGLERGLPTAKPRTRPPCRSTRSNGLIT